MKPVLTRKEIEMQFRAVGAVKGKVLVSPNDMIGGDYESFLDLLSIRLIGDELLCDTRYYAVGVEDGDVVFEVTGDPSMSLDDD